MSSDDASSREAAARDATDDERRRRAFRLESGAQRIQRDVDEEMEFHLAMRTEKLVRLGRTAQAAREEALQQFGDVTTVRTECIAINREHHRAMNRVNRLQDLRQDITYAIRSLRNNKGFAAVTILILALGIGANTAMFSLIDVLLLRALPVPHAEQLVTIGNPNMVGATSQGAARSDFFSYQVYTDVRDATTTMSGVYATGSTKSIDVIIQSDSSIASQAEHPFARFVSGNYFDVLQKPPALGRGFSNTEGRTSGDAPVVVIGYKYWQRRFAGNSSAIGKTIRINEAPYTIIGIGAQDFNGDLVDRAIDIYIPLTMQPLVNQHTEWLADREVNFLQMMGRLKPAATVAQARADASAIISRSILDHAKAGDHAAYQEMLRDKPVLVEAGSQGFSVYRRTYTKSMYTLMAAVVMVLLVVCANVANLLLARATARAREMSVRMALGASRLRLVQQLLTESVLIAFLGGALGLFVATWCSRGLLYLANNGGTGITLDARLDGRVLAFTATVSLVTAALFGLLPAFRATRVELATALRASGRNVTGTGGRFSIGRLLVVAQVAMSVMLLVGTGMLLRSLQRMNDADIGVDRNHIVVADLEVQRLGLKAPQVLALIDEMVRQVRAVPGVVDASVSENGVFSGTESQTSLSVEGFVGRSAADSNASYDDVGAAYFRTVNARMLGGRDFTDRDNESGAKVAVVNETFAKFYFPDGNALGHRVTMNGEAREIVGLVADVNGSSLRELPSRRLYVPMKQFDELPGDFYLQIRVSGDPASAIAPLRRAIQSANANLPIRRINALSELIHDSVSQDRLVAQVVTMFGVLTLVLSALGLYGVMAYATLRRTSEFGLRLALGALPSSIVRMVLREALSLTVVGVLVGLPLAFGMTRLLRDQFYEVGAVDVPSLLIAVVVLAIAATAAGYLPAMRAARVAPLDALRAE